MRVSDIFMAAMLLAGGTCSFGQTAAPTLSKVSTPYPAMTGSIPIQVAGGIYSPNWVAYGSVGTPLVLSGSGFGSVQGTVTFTGYYNNKTTGLETIASTVLGSVTSWTANAINVSVPSGASAGLIEIVTANGVSNGLPFVVTNGSYSSSCPSSVAADTLRITTTSLPNGTVNTSYSAQLQASGGSGQYSWTIVDGDLPDGLALSSSGAIIGRAVSAEGPLSLTVEVVDSGSPNQAADVVLSIEIVANPAGEASTGLYSFAIQTGAGTGGYDSAGNVTNFVDSVIGTWSNIQYDSLNRLSLAAQLPTTGSTQYFCWDYDAFGNRLHQQITSGAGYSNGAGATCQPGSGSTLISNQWANYTVDGTSSTVDNGKNRLTGSPSGIYQYDGVGNITYDGANQYLFDGDGRLCAVQVPLMTGGYRSVQYIYDAEGNRVAKGAISTFSCDTTANGFTPSNVYILGPDGEQMTEIDNTSASQTPNWLWAHTNVYASGQLVATYDADLTGATEGTLSFQLSDWLGTRRQQADYAGNPLLNFISLPFGDGLSSVPVSTSSTTDATEHHFTGKERDSESGLDYFGARYYASSMGRFSSPDPSGLFYADPTNPQSFNLYGYVMNNPLINVDPNGLDCIHINNDTGAYEGFERGDCDNSTEDKANTGRYIDGTVNTIYTSTGDTSGIVGGYSGTKDDGSGTLISGTFASGISQPVDMMSMSQDDRIQQLAIGITADSQHSFGCIAQAYGLGAPSAATGQAGSNLFNASQNLVTKPRFGGALGGSTSVTSEAAMAARASSWGSIPLRVPTPVGTPFTGNFAMRSSSTLGGAAGRYAPYAGAAGKALGVAGTAYSSYQLYNCLGH